MARRTAILLLAHVSVALSMTCNDVKEFYRSNECCGHSDKEIPSSCPDDVRPTITFGDLTLKTPQQRMATSGTTYRYQTLPITASWPNMNGPVDVSVGAYLPDWSDLSKPFVVHFFRTGYSSNRRSDNIDKDGTPIAVEGGDPVITPAWSMVYDPTAWPYDLSKPSVGALTGLTGTSIQIVDYLRDVNVLEIFIPMRVPFPDSVHGYGATPGLYQTAIHPMFAGSKHLAVALLGELSKQISIEAVTFDGNSGGAQTQITPSMYAWENTGREEDSGDGSALASWYGAEGATWLGGRDPLGWLKEDGENGFGQNDLFEVQKAGYEVRYWGSYGGWCAETPSMSKYIADGRYDCFNLIRNTMYPVPTFIHQDKEDPLNMWQGPDTFLRNDCPFGGPACVNGTSTREPVYMHPVRMWTKAHAERWGFLHTVPSVSTSQVEFDYNLQWNLDDNTVAGMADVETTVYHTAEKDFLPGLSKSKSPNGAEYVLHLSDKFRRANGATCHAVGCLIDLYGETKNAKPLREFYIKHVIGSSESQLILSPLPELA